MKVQTLLGWGLEGGGAAASLAPLTPMALLPAS